jgi:hypothetical protein
MQKHPVARLGRILFLWKIPRSTLKCYTIIKICWYACAVISRFNDLCWVWHSWCVAICDCHVAQPKTITGLYVKCPLLCWNCFCELVKELCSTRYLSDSLYLNWCAAPCKLFNAQRIIPEWICGSSYLNWCAAPCNWVHVQLSISKLMCNYLYLNWCAALYNWIHVRIPIPDLKCSSHYLSSCAASCNWVHVRIPIPELMWGVVLQSWLGSLSFPPPV